MCGRIYTDYMIAPTVPCYDRFREVMSKHPEFEAYGKQFAAEMSDYLAKRATITLDPKIPV